MSIVYALLYTSATESNFMNKRSLDPFIDLSPIIYSVLTLNKSKQMSSHVDKPCRLLKKKNLLRDTKYALLPRNVGLQIASDIDTFQTHTNVNVHSVLVLEHAYIHV